MLKGRGPRWCLHCFTFTPSWCHTKLVPASYTTHQSGAYVIHNTPEPGAYTRNRFLHTRCNTLPFTRSYTKVVHMPTLHKDTKVVPIIILDSQTKKNNNTPRWCLYIYTTQSPRWCLYIYTTQSPRWCLYIYTTQSPRWCLHYIRGHQDGAYTQPTLHQTDACTTQKDPRNTTLPDTKGRGAEEGVIETSQHGSRYNVTKTQQPAWQYGTQNADPHVTEV
jgi:hypothetical protein